MADTISRSYALQIDTLFVDGDTRKFSLKNPKSDLSSSDIDDLNTFMQESGILIGDKYGGRFGKILTATKVEKETVTLDLNDTD